MPYAAWLSQNRTAAGNPLTLPPPPSGTYDSSIDYSSGAANRGFQQFGDDAQTQFEQGQQDFTHGLGLLDQAQGRVNQDYGTQTADLGHQYGILGHQQAEHAAQQGITSAGLLGKSQSVRDANQAHDQTALYTNATRAGQDITDQRNQLTLGNARTFGGFNGTLLNDPYTGQPVAGTLLTGLQRAGAENIAYQGGLLGQKISGAQANGYVSPLLKPDSSKYGYVGSTPLNAQQYNAGFGLESMLRSSAKIQGKSYEQTARDAGFDPVTLKRIA